MPPSEPRLTHRPPCSEAAAIAAGFTKPVIADSSMHTLELLIKPDADLDGTFAA